jgi:peptidoglycan/LPS O-acetylase OafA/YrhL
MTFHLGWHLPLIFEPLAHTGWMGVDLFFVLSGYLIGLQLLKPVARGKRPSLMQFYRRRAYRILPAYLLVVLLYFAVPIWRERPGISPLWQFLTFTENLFVDYAHNQAFSHVWSLCIEEHFYLLLPLVVLALIRRPSLRKTTAVIAAIVLFGLAIRTWVLLFQLRAIPVEGVWGALYIERLYYPTYTRLDGLVAGVVLATVQVFRPAGWGAIMRRGHLLTLTGCALTALAIWMFWDRFGSDTGLEAWSVVVGFPIASLGLALLTASAISEAGLLARVRVPGAGTISMLAFSLYLTHKEIAHLDEVWFPAMAGSRTWAALLLLAGNCGIAAAILYYCVERPFMLLRDRHIVSSKRTPEDEAVLDPAL